MPLHQKRPTTTWAASARAQPARRGKRSCFSPERLYPRRWKAETERSSFCHQRTTTAPSSFPPGGNPGDPRVCKDRGLTRVAWHVVCALGGPELASRPSATLLEAMFCFSCLPFPLAHVHFSTVDFFCCFDRSLPPYLCHNPEN